MGRYLADEAMDHAPDTLTSSELLVLYVIAADARDETRLGYPGMDLLMRRTRMSARRIRENLTEMAGKGVELRVPLGIGRDGKPYFSKPGQRTTYRIPIFTGPARTLELVHSHPEEGGGTPPPYEPQGGGTPPLRRRNSATLSSGSRQKISDQHAAPDEPVDNSQSRRRRARGRAALIQIVIDELEKRTDVTVSSEHANAVIDHVLSERTGIEKPGAYLRGVIRQDRSPRRFLPTYPIANGAHP